MKKLTAILLATLFSVFLIAGSAMATPINVRPIAGSVASDFSTLQSNFNTEGLAIDAYADQTNFAYFEPTGEGSTATYEFSYTWGWGQTAENPWEIGLYDLNDPSNTLKLFDYNTGVPAGTDPNSPGSVSVTWDNSAGNTVSYWHDGTSAVDIDSASNFGPVFGFYLYNGLPTGQASGTTLYSDDALNGGAAQMLTYELDSYWYVAMEGLVNPSVYTSGNGDFNDFVVKVESIAPVPEPATMVLFGAGLLGLAAIGRKKFIG